MGHGSLWAAAQTLAFVQVESLFTLGAEVPTETVLTVHRTALWMGVGVGGATHTLSTHSSDLVFEVNGCFLCCSFAQFISAYYFTRLNINSINDANLAQSHTELIAF